MTASTPLVSVLVTTYRRVDLLRRNLECCGEALRGVESSFEVVVGDNAAEPAVEQETNRFHERTGIPIRCLGEPVTGTMQRNQTRVVNAARGEWFQFVHDDDFLLPGAGRTILQSIAENPGAALIKHRVAIGSIDGRIRRYEGGRARRLSPREAVGMLISEASFARFPAILWHRASFLEAGGFDESVDLYEDLEVWLRIAHRHGLRISEGTTAFYTIHEGAATNRMFTRDHLHGLEQLLTQYGANAGFSGTELKQRMGKFLWRFGLAGCLRAIRNKDRVLLRERLGLIDQSGIRSYPCPWQWRPLVMMADVLKALP